MTSRLTAFSSPVTNQVTSGISASTGFCVAMRAASLTSTV